MAKGTIPFLHFSKSSRACSSPSLPPPPSLPTPCPPNQLTAHPANHPYIRLAITLLTTLFYFAGFIALSVFLGKLLFCRGSVCSAARADAAFAAFSWMLWTASAGLMALDMFKGVGGAKADKKMSMKEVDAGLGA